MSKVFEGFFCFLLICSSLGQPVAEASADPTKIFSLALNWYSGYSHPTTLLSVLEGGHPFEGTYTLRFTGAGNWSNGRLVVNQGGSVSGQINSNSGTVVRYNINGSVQDDGSINANLVGIPATRFGTMSGDLFSPDQPVGEVSGSGSWFISTVGSGNWSTELMEAP